MFGVIKHKVWLFFWLQLHFAVLYTMNTTERTLFFAGSEHSPCLLRYQTFFFCRQRGLYYWSHLISYQISTKPAVSPIHVFRCRSLFERLSTPHSMRKCQLILKSSWWVKRSSICILFYSLFPFYIFFNVFSPLPSCVKFGPSFSFCLSAGWGISGCIQG